MKQNNFWNRFFYKETLEEEKNKYSKFKKLIGLYPELHERIVNAKELQELLDLHKKAFADGFRNQNLDVCEYGMFRAKSISSMEPKDVFLGNINGLWTHEMSYWEKSKEEPFGVNGYGIARDVKIYDMIVGQYRRHLVNNINAIKNEATHFIKEYDELNKPIDPFKCI